MKDCKRCGYNKAFFCSACPHREENKPSWTFIHWLVFLVMFAISLMSLFLWFNPRLV